MKLHKELTPGVTYEENVTDAVYKIPHSKLHVNDMEAKYVLINVGSNNAKYAYGGDPASGGIGHPVAAGEDIELHSFNEAQDFRIINDTAASGIDLTITIFYK